VKGMIEMKKILLISIFLFLICIVKNVSAVEDYNTFQEVDIYSGKMLDDYTTEEYNKYYKNVDKRKFWGWRTHVVNKNIKAKFISETVFSYYNNGKTPITYKYELSKSVVNKYSISASGSIKYNINGEIKKFKNNLDAEVKINVTDETVTTTKEQNDLQIIIDPFTVANLKIVGEAKITNGVAAYYVLWIRTERGGFEYFVVTTQYPRLEVLPV
jgi:hypothetical protein